ncbi:MAG: ABC transporter permease subunit [Bacillota bacterium]|nr:ABC transporter permease subunit [Bacillota bacterium]
MDKIYANTLNECEKIFSKKKTIVFLVLTAILSVLAAVIIPIFQSRFGIIVVNAEAFPVIILNLFTAFLIPLYVLMAVTDLFSGEVHDKNLKLVLLRPVSRFKVFISKNIAVFIYTSINLSIILIISLICDIFYKLPGDYIRAILNGFGAALVSLLPQLILTLFIACICQFFNNSTGAFVTSIFILVMAKILSYIFPAVSKVLFINYFSWSTSWISSSAAGSRLFTGFMLLISYGIILFTVGYYLFDKKDI